MKPIWTLMAVSMAATMAQAADPVSTAYAGNAEAGKAKSVVCAACHGADGNSAIAEYPKLAGQHASYLATSLKGYRDGSRVNAIMQGMAMPLSDEDIADLSAYFASQKVSPGAADPELVARGEELFRFGDAAKGISACTACHTPTGGGLASAGFPALKGQWPAYTEVQLKAYREGSRVHNMMNGVAKNMSDQDIKAVASYVSGLR